MYCDDCASPLEMELREYMERKEQDGAVLCADCRSSWSWVSDVEPVRPRV